MMLGLLGTSSLITLILIVAYPYSRVGVSAHIAWNIQLVLASFTIAGTYLGFSPEYIQRDVALPIFSIGLTLAIFSAFQASAKLVFSYRMRMEHTQSKPG